VSCLALVLADDYSIRSWILALLDPAAIEIGPKDKITGTISSPPKFALSIADKDKLFPPPDMAPSATPQRSRAKRSVSPAKALAGAPPSPRKIASPRKRTARAASAKAEEKAVEKSSKTVPEKVEEKDESLASSEVRVVAQETVEKKDDAKITKTTVTVTMPSSNPDLPLPKNLSGVIDKAKGMIEEANKHDALVASKSSSSKKRKASTSLTKDGKEGESAAEKPAAKKQKTDLEERLMTERVRTRALIGLTASLVIG
jgi:hypothetical protein